MDYEEKYKKALHNARVEILANPGLRKMWEEIFPELRESEDERMRKRAIAILKYQRDYWSYDGPMEKSPPATPRKDLVDAIDVALSELEKQKEQKPVEWSEEDEKQLDDIISIIREAYEHGITISETRHRNAYFWLNNLRPQPKQEWNESDDLMLQSVYETLYDHQCVIRTGKMGKIDRDYVAAIDKQIAWLKSLRPSWKPSEEQIEAVRYFVNRH